MANREVDGDAVEPGIKGRGPWKDESLAKAWAKASCTTSRPSSAEPIKCAMVW